MGYDGGMIVRIVKMTFDETKVDQFIAMTETLKPKIIAYDGCRYLDILQDVKQKNVLFSYSHWDSEEHLDHYRYSEFFKDTWRTLSQWFSDKPTAWSTIVVQ